LNDGAVQRKSFKFALDIIKLYSKLQEQKEYVISKQLLRSGTSIGANVQEAIGGESRKDFASKMSIARKEARETRYWLCLLRESDLTDMKMANELIAVDELLRLLTAIIMTARQNPPPPDPS
jgi:four helix bundle protein